MHVGRLLAVGMVALWPGCGDMSAEARCDANRATDWSAIPRGEPCPEGYFRHYDLRGTEQVGDDLCHKLCCDSWECGFGETCRWVGLWETGDYQCNGAVRMCMAGGADECAP